MKVFARLIFIFILWFSFCPLLAQISKAPAPIRLQYGKQLLKEGQSELAIDIFAGVGQLKKDSLVPNALYYQALALYQSGQLHQSDSILSRCQTLYPDWKHKAEAQYLQSIVSFETGKPKTALDFLALCCSEASYLNAPAKAAKSFFFKRIEEPDSLGALLRIFPKDTILANALASSLSFSSDTATKPLFDSLVMAYNLNNFKKHIRQKVQKWPKGIYKIGVLLPFIQKNKPADKLVLEFYIGLQLAAKALSKEGLLLRLYAYDTRHDSSTIAKLLSNPELEQMNLLIGPLFRKDVRLLQDFARKHQIAMINPLSVLPDSAYAHQYAYQTMPTYQTQILKSAHFAFSHSPHKSVAILYGASKKDSILANLYRAKCIENKIKILVFKGIDNRNAITISSFFKYAIADSLGHIFVSSSQPNDAFQWLTAMEMLDLQLPTLVQQEWLEAGVETWQWERQKVYFVLPSYIFPNAAKFAESKRIYENLAAQPPSYFVCQGFETLHFFGRMLALYGHNFTPILRRGGWRKGCVSAGFEFSASPDNQFVPIFSFTNGDFAQVR